MTKYEYFSMAARLWRSFESVTRVRALVVCLFVALVIVFSSQAAASTASAASTEELPADSNLVIDGGFAVDLSQWQVLDPAAFWNASDADSDVQSGSLGVNEPAPTALEEIVAARQCVPIPAPGQYALSVFVKGSSVPPAFQDSPMLRWSYRADSFDCSGAATSSGELFVPPTGSWRGPNSPVVLDLAPGNWTVGATVEIVLAVVRSPNDDKNSGIEGRFDRVSLRPHDVLFETGFE